MADKKVSALTELTAGQVADGDYVPIVDISEVADADKNKRWSWSAVKADIKSWFAGAGGITTVAGADLFVAMDASDSNNIKTVNADVVFQLDLTGQVDQYTDLDGGGDGTELLILEGAVDGIKYKRNVNTLISDRGISTAGNTQTLTNKTIDADNNTITNIGTSELSDEGVTLAKMAHIATNRILGRETAGTGDVEALTATQVRTIINVENGADVTDTANVTAAGALMDSEVTDLAGIKALQTSTLQLKPLEGAFVDGDKTKLDGIATGAQVNTVDSVNTQTGAVVLDADDISDAATTNKFTTAADISKLAGIESGADVTDATNVIAALSGATITDAGAPQATDRVLVQDASDSNNLKYVDYADFASGTTVDVVSNVAQDRILGRITAGSGDSEELTAAQVRTLINVEDGADVTDSSNVDAAGAVMNSDTSTAAMSFVVDEDNMVSNLATKVPTQQSVKAYVDTGLSGKQDTITNSDSITEGSTNLFMTTSERSKLSGIETGADVTDVDNVSTAIAAATGKATPVDADVFNMLDSAASMILKKITWSELKSAIKSYYDAVTATLTNKTLTDAVNSVSTPTTTSVGYLGVPQESKSADYTLVLADAGKHIYHPASDANDRTFTIPANASVAYPIGTTVTFVNLSANTLTIAITSDTMNLIGAGTTGSRALAQYGMATALKVASTTWVINGINLS